MDFDMDRILGHWRYVEGNRVMVLVVCELNKMKISSNEASIVHCQVPPK